jgi:hypothetical protein
LNAGVDVIDVMKTGGWKGTSMVSRYAIFDSNASRRVMEKLEHHQRAIEALAQAEKQLNPDINPSGVTSGQSANGKETVRLQ